MAYVKKLVSITPEQLEDVIDLAAKDPAYRYNRRPNESAVVREALDLFFAARKSNNTDCKPESNTAA